MATSHTRSVASHDRVPAIQQRDPGSSQRDPASHQTGSASHQRSSASHQRGSASRRRERCRTSPRERSFAGGVIYLTLSGPGGATYHHHLSTSDVAGGGLELQQWTAAAAVDHIVVLVVFVSDVEVGVIARSVPICRRGNELLVLTADVIGSVQCPHLLANNELLVLTAGALKRIKRCKTFGFQTAMNGIKGSYKRKQCGYLNSMQIPMAVRHLSTMKCIPASKPKHRTYLTLDKNTKRTSK